MSACVSVVFLTKDAGVDQVVKACSGPLIETRSKIERQLAREEPEGQSSTNLNDAIIAFKAGLKLYDGQHQPQRLAKERLKHTFDAIPYVSMLAPCPSIN